MYTYIYTNLMVACIEVPITNTRSSATYCVISSTFYVVVFLNSTRCTNTKIIREDLLRAHRGTCKIIQDKNTRIIVLFKVQNLNYKYSSTSKNLFYLYTIHLLQHHPFLSLYFFYQSVASVQKPT